MNKNLILIILHHARKKEKEKEREKVSLYKVFKDTSYIFCEKIQFIKSQLFLHLLIAKFILPLHKIYLIIKRLIAFQMSLKCTKLYYYNF